MPILNYFSTEQTTAGSTTWQSIYKIYIYTYMFTSLNYPDITTNWVTATIDSLLFYSLGVLKYRPKLFTLFKARLPYLSKSFYVIMKHTDHYPQNPFLPIVQGQHVFGDIHFEKVFLARYRSSSINLAFWLCSLQKCHICTHFQSIPHQILHLKCFRYGRFKTKPAPEHLTSIEPVQ